MPDPVTLVPPVVAPLAPIVGAPAVSAPTPGWKTTEAWLTLLVILLGGLFTSGLVVETSQLGKMISFGLTVLAALGYQYQRTSLKTAHVNAGMIGGLPESLLALKAANDNGECPSCGAKVA